MDSDETLSARAAEEIRALLARRRVTGRELARRLGVSQPWVSGRLTGSIEIGLNDLQRMAAALEVEWPTLLPAPAKSREGGNMHPSSRMPARSTTTLTPRPTRGRYAPHTSGAPTRGHEPAWACPPVTS